MVQSNSSSSNNSWVLVGVIFIAVLAIAWFFIDTTSSEQPLKEVEKVSVSEQKVEPELVLPEPIEPEPVEPESILELDDIATEGDVETEVVVESPIPTLADSDNWLRDNLPEITWRKELLKLIITEDLIQRFVVFTDNFVQGNIAYEHSPLTLPASSFTAIIEKSDDNNELMFWDEKATARFSLYVELLRSVDNETLVKWYFELKPLFDQAYASLGYEDENFTEVLQDAITRVLDMEIPSDMLELERPSVMYTFKNQEVESLDDADKLLLRLGKDNLLIIKSVLLEISEKLARGDEQ